MIKYFHGTYIGDRTDLRDKTALVEIYEDPTSSHDLNPLTVAQFDDTKTGLGFGWHTFHRCDFVEDPKSD